jgi:hypothetical protein
MGYGQKSIGVFSGGDLLPALKSTGIPKHDHAKRAQVLAVNPLIQEYGNVEVNDTLLFELFDDVRFKAIVEKTTKDINHSTSHRAKINDFDYSYVFISTNKGRTLINIDLPDKDEQYKLFYDNESGRHIMIEVDKDKLERVENVPSLMPPIEQDINEISPSKKSTGTVDSENEQQPSPLGSTEPDEITLMIVYTPAAASWAAGNEGGIANTIASLMQRSQLALDNSNLDVVLNLVYASEVDYVEQHTNDDLYKLTGTADGYMDEIHAWRNEYHADLVVLLEETNFTGGLGWLLQSINGSPTYGFSLTRVQQASWTYTVIHEIGHNMGAHHHKDQNFQPGPTYWWNWSENTWSAGWRWTGTNNSRYCTVMTYSNGQYFDDGLNHTEVPYFSSPDIEYMGVAGHAVDGDNVRTLHETKYIVADYRIEPEPLVPLAYELDNHTLASGETDCFNASETITVAQNGPVLIQSGASANFIAGQSIRFLPGFHAQAGSTVNAWITTDASFCDALPAPIMAAPPIAVEKSIEENSMQEENNLFGEKSVKVFPNPNSGVFTVALEGFDSETRVMIFNIMGQNVYDANINGQQHTIELPNIQRGVYFVKAINNAKHFDQKIVIQ